MVLLDFIFSSFLLSFSGGHPSHCRPCPVLLDLFLRLSPLPVVTHSSADPDWCWRTLFSVVLFSADTHPNADRVRRCLTFFFDCLLFRWSPIQVLTQNGAAGLHLQLSRFQRSPIPLLTEPGAACPFSSIVFSSDGHPSECRHFLVLLDFIFSYPVSPTENRARCCLTFSFDCLFLRPSPIHVPSWPGAAGLHLRLSRFQRSPIPLPTEPGAA